MESYSSLKKKKIKFFSVILNRKKLNPFYFKLKKKKKKKKKKKPIFFSLQIPQTKRSIDPIPARECTSPRRQTHPNGNAAFKTN
jgi:hypothetical protein